MSVTIEEEHAVLALGATAGLKSFGTQVDVQEVPRRTITGDENDNDNDHDNDDDDRQTPSRASSATSLATASSSCDSAGRTAETAATSTAPSVAGDDKAPLPGLPATQSALIITPSRGYALVADFAVPAELGPGEVMIRNKATGLNHIDWMSVEYNFCLPELPWITGREMAGVVEAVGSDVARLRKGDHVWTSRSLVPVLYFRSFLYFLFFVHSP